MQLFILDMSTNVGADNLGTSEFAFKLRHWLKLVQNPRLQTALSHFLPSEIMVLDVQLQHASLLKKVAESMKDL